MVFKPRPPKRRPRPTPRPPIPKPGRKPKPGPKGPLKPKGPGRKPPRGPKGPLKPDFKPHGGGFKPDYSRRPNIMLKRRKQLSGGKKR